VHTLTRLQRVGAIATEKLKLPILCAVGADATTAAVTGDTNGEHAGQVCYTDFYITLL
jgi:hypothetical protein